MATGPGKYDDLATYVRVQSDAEAAIVIVLGGTKGSGFSVQAIDLVHDTVVHRLPALMRNLADQIEANLKKGHA